MTKHDWNDNYATGQLPWDTGQPDPQLVELVQSGRLPKGRALEVGAGTGTNAIWLAQQGFEVLGVDIAPLAVEQARAKLQDPALPCRFAALDFLDQPVEGGPYDFVFDRGCFHVFDDGEERARFAARVAACLAPGGLWLSLCGSTEGPPRDTGPPRRSARDLVLAVEPELEILDLRATHFGDPGEELRSWSCLCRLRTLPAQPSTRRA